MVRTVVVRYDDSDDYDDGRFFWAIASCQSSICRSLGQAVSFTFVKKSQPRGQGVAQTFYVVVAVDVRGALLESRAIFRQGLCPRRLWQGFGQPQSDPSHSGLV